MYKNAARRGQSIRNTLSGTIFGPAGDHRRTYSRQNWANPPRKKRRKQPPQPASPQKSAPRHSRQAAPKPPQPAGRSLRAQTIVMSGTPTSGDDTPVMNPMLRAIWRL